MLGIRVRDLMMLVHGKDRADARRVADGAVIPALPPGGAFNALAYFAFTSTNSAFARRSQDGLVPARLRREGFSAMARTLMSALADLDDFTWREFPRRGGAEHDRALGLGGEDEGEAVQRMLIEAGAAGAAAPESLLRSV